MGNCLRHESWVGEDWGSFSSKRTNKTYYVAADGDGENLLGESSGATAVKGEVKIKVSKKELKELLRKVKARGLTAEQVLARLMTNGGDVAYNGETSDQRLWRPVLQSIPEAD